MSLLPNSLASWRRHSLRPRDRRGVTIMLVLSLVAMTLGLSYALLRSQGTALKIQQNSERRGDARQAAVAGLNTALQKMTQTGWAGIASTVNGTLSGTESFTATYAVGDPGLTSASSDYNDFPYRVTIYSTGTATDPSNASVKSTHKMRAVVRLIPRKVADHPADLATMLNYTVYQTEERDFKYAPPSRIEGPVRIQGRLDLGETYRWSNGARARFLSDLNSIRLSGNGDYRPFNTTVAVDHSRTDSSTRGILTSQLGLSAPNTPAAAVAASWTHPGSLGTYRLYTGGPTYNVQTVSATLAGVTLAPNPLTNPLGLFYVADRVTIEANVNITGTLIAGDGVVFRGANLQLAANNLSKLDGSTRPVQLPVLVAAKEVRFEAGAIGSVTGMITSWDKFEVQQRSQSNNLSVTGRLVAREVDIGGRNQWDFSSLTWATIYTLFGNQILDANGTGLFPVYLAIFGANSVPSVTIKPETTPVTYHWHRGSNPVFVPLAADGGLRWEVLEWIDVR